MLRQRIETNLELPMQSQTAAQVIAFSHDEERDTRELTALIDRDPALAGHVLSLANSAAYVGRELSTSLQQAVGRLGVSTICEIAVAVSLKGRVFDVPGYATMIRELWIHAAATAVFARELALDRHADADGLFLCGLLHDVGKPVVMQNLSDIVRKKTSQPVPKGIMRLAMNEFHEEVGGMLVEEWGFPDWMVDVVRLHERYELMAEHVEAARILNLASALASWALDLGSRPEDFDASAPIVAELGIELDELNALLDRRAEVLEIADAFL